MPEPQQPPSIWGEVDALLSAPPKPASSSSIWDDVDSLLATPAPTFTPETMPRTRAFHDEEAARLKAETPVMEAHGFTQPESVKVTEPAGPPDPRFGETVRRSRTGALYTSPPMGQGILDTALDVPIQGAKDIAAGVTTLGRMATEPTGPANVPDARVPRGRMTGLVGKATPVPDETLQAATQVINGAFELASPVAAASFIAAPMATAITVGLAILADKTGKKVADLAGGSPAEQEFVGALSGALAAAGVGADQILRMGKRGIIELGQKARAAGDRAVAAREAAKVITPDENVIDIQSVRQALPPAGRPPPPIEGYPQQPRPVEPPGAPVGEAAVEPRPVEPAQTPPEAIASPRAVWDDVDTLLSTPPVDVSGRALGGHAGPAERRLTVAGPPAGTPERRKLPAEQVRADLIANPGAMQAADAARERTEVAKAEARAAESAQIPPAGLEPAPVKPPVQTGETHDYSSTQIDLPPDTAAAVKALGARIPKADLQPGEKGKEDEPHVTVKYGLHTADAEKVRELLANEPPITVTLGKTSFFPNGESGSGDVLKVDIDSPDLHRLNAKIADALEHTDTHPDYEPHATIAYLKPGKGKEYAGDTSLEGRTVTIDRLTFSGKDGTLTEIPLQGESHAVATGPVESGNRLEHPRDEGQRPSAAGRSGGGVVERRPTPEPGPSGPAPRAGAAPLTPSRSPEVPSAALRRGELAAQGQVGVESARGRPEAIPTEAPARILPSGGRAEPDVPQGRGVLTARERADRRRAREAVRAATKADVAQYEQDDLDSLVAHAKAQGYTGDPVALRSELANHLQDFKDLHTEMADSGHNGLTLLRAIAKGGGISERAETGQKGEIRWLKEFQDTQPSSAKGARGNLAKQPVVSGQVRGVRGVFSNGPRGMNFDRAVEYLSQDPRFTHIRSINDLHEAIRKAATEEDDASSAMDSLSGWVESRDWARGGEARESTSEFEQDLAAIRAPGEYRPDLAGPLSIYSASRGRPVVTADALSASGSRAQRPSDPAGNQGAPPEAVRPSGGRTVTRAELQQLADTHGTTLEVQQTRAERAGYTVTGAARRPPLPERTSSAPATAFSGFDPSLDTFYEDSVKPVAGPIVGILKGAKDLALNLVEPALPVRKNLKGGEAAYAQVIRAVHRPDVEALAFGAQHSPAFDANFNQLEQFFNRFTHADLDAFGLTIGTPTDIQAQRLQEAARVHVQTKGDPRLRDPRLKQAIRDTSDYVYRLARSAGFELRYLQDYFYGTYKDHSAVDRFMDHWTTTERWTKEKVFPTRADAAVFHLVLRDVNPITNIRSELHSVATRAGLKDLVEGYFEPPASAAGAFALTGAESTPAAPRVLKPEAQYYAVQTADANPAQRRDWRPITEPLFQGLLFEPRYAALVNSLIETNKVTRNPTLAAIRALGFKAQQLKFFGSIFHLQNELKASVAAELGSVFNPAGWADFAKSFKGIDETDPAYREYIALGGGHRYSLEAAAQSQMEKALDQIARGNLLGGALRVPAVALQQKWIPASPGFVTWMFDQLIPALKFRKWQHEGAREAARLGRALTDAEQIRIIRENQNFYGEMNERLFGRSATVTSALRLVFLAPGYGEGNFRTAIKGMTGPVAAARRRRRAAGGGSPPPTEGAGETPPPRDEGGSTTRSAQFIFHTLLYTLILATVGTRLLTGEWPDVPKRLKDVRDVFKVRTSQLDANGRVVYVDLMTYDKDYWTLFGNIVTGQPEKIGPELATRIGNATSVTFRLLTDLSMLFQGRMIFDWHHDPIYAPTDGFGVKFAKVVAFEADQLAPISLSTFTAGRQSGLDRLKAAGMAVMGWRRTTSEAEKPSAALQYLFDTMPPSGPPSPATEARHDLRIALEEKDQAAILDARKRLSPRSAQQVAQQMRRHTDQLQRVFRSATLTTALHAYELMTPEERGEVRTIMDVKIRNAPATTPPNEIPAMKLRVAHAKTLPYTHGSRP